MYLEEARQVGFSFKIKRGLFRTCSDTLRWPRWYRKLASLQKKLRSTASSFRPAITYQTTSIMGRVEALVLLSTLTTSVLAAGSPRPIGVGPECISPPHILVLPHSISTITIGSIVDKFLSTQLPNSTSLQIASHASPTPPSRSCPLKSTMTTVTVQMAQMNLGPQLAHTSPHSHLRSHSLAPLKTPV